MGGDQAAGGALPRLVFQIEQSIQMLGRALPPDAAQKLDAAVQTIREAVATSLAGGAPGQAGPSPTQQGGPF